MNWKGQRQVESFRAYGVLAAVLLGAALAAPGSLAGTSAPTLVVTNVADSGQGSLRDALLNANSNAGADNIVFAIPGTGVQRIQLLSALPYIDDPVTIDGSTQLGYTGTPLIEISGTNVPDDSGLVIRTSNCTIRSLTINGFGHDGIAILGDTALGNVIEACYVGTDASGTLAVGNGTAQGSQYGIRLSAGASQNLVQECLVSGNQEGGITIEESSNFNSVVNNQIGTDVNGVAPLPNNGQGLLIQNNAGSATVAGNLISGNEGDGVHLFNSSGNSLRGNIIGANRSCDASLENRGVGVYLTDTSETTAENFIGGPFAGDGNLISGNFRDGIRIEGGGVTATVIQGNLIGTDGTGTSIVANGDGGVSIIDSSGHQIGGPDLTTYRVNPQPAKGSRTVRKGQLRATNNEVPPTAELGVTNILSGNGADGVFISGASSMENLVRENRIGTTLDGLAPLANNGAGILIRRAGANTVTYNTISGNNVAGVNLAQTAIGNVIEDNYIGTDPAGAVKVGGAGPGVILETEASENYVSANLISGNGGEGVYLRSGASGNVIIANRIGVDNWSESAIPNGLSGVRVESSGNQIGGIEGATNIIAGNGLDGITLAQRAASFNQISGNQIGSNGYGDLAIPNQRHGIAITDEAANNVIGPYNLIAHNLQTGVSVTGGSGNEIRWNYIHHNGRLGIDLNEDAVTFNDPEDADEGPNGLQNYPVITDITEGAESTHTITGTLDSEPNKTYQLDFYSTTDIDPSGHGEGEYYLDSTSVTTDDTGHAEFSYNTYISDYLPSGITATATDESGNSSEFSGNFGLGIDVDRPVITNCTVTPRNLPSAGGTVTLSADITDESALEVVRAAITHPNGETTTVNLEAVQQSATFTGTFDAPANALDAPQQYSVKIEAIDAYNNRAVEDCGVFTVAAADVTPPTITDCTVEPRILPSSGGYVLFRATITDASGLATTQVLVTNPDMSETIVPLNRQQDTDTYEFNYMLPGNFGAADLSYVVRFKAVDTASNQTIQPCGTITVAAPDVNGPAITNVLVNPRSLPVSGGTVQIRADLTDVSGVALAEAVITNPDASVSRVTLVRQGESNTFQGTFSAPENAGVDAVTYAVKISATDTRQQNSELDAGLVTVAGLDREAPTVVSCSLAPNTLPASGGAVQVQAEVTDNVAVTQVLARVLRNGSLIATVPLTAGTGSNYTATFAALPNRTGSAQEYSVELIARDAAGNSRTVPCGTYTVEVDTVAPVILYCEATPRSFPAEGGQVTFLATVSDAIPLSRVVAIVTRPDGAPQRVTLQAEGVDQYRGTWRVPANDLATVRTYQVAVEAVDVAGNETTEACGELVVAEASGGKAQVSAKNLSFGRVRFGTRVRRQFVIRNVSSSSSLAVSLSTLNVPFTVKVEGLGAGAATLSANKKANNAPPIIEFSNATNFAIPAGRIVTVYVFFAPPAINSYNDRLLITTSDPRHRQFRVRVTGLGCKNGQRGTPIGNDDSPENGAAPKKTTGAAKKKKK